MGSVLPIISYAISVWAHAIDRQFVIQPLASLQRRVAIRIIKGYRTISIDAANVLAKLTPIDLYLKGRAVIYFAKKPISNRLTEDYLQNTIDLDNIQRPIDCYRLKHYALRQQINQSNNDSTNCKLLITGYKGLDGTGSSYIIHKKETIIKQKTLKLSPNCSRFESILFATLSALDFIVKTVANQSIAIYFEEMSIIYAINNHNSTNPLIYGIYNNYYLAKENGIEMSIQLTNFDNEIYGQLVKDNARLAYLSHQSFAYDSVSETYVKHLIYEKNRQIWENRWQSMDDYKWISN